jgi:Tat protein secretion system quality control protein TatD with DNase activity
METSPTAPLVEQYVLIVPGGNSPPLYMSGQQARDYLIARYPVDRYPVGTVPAVPPPPGMVVFTTVAASSTATTTTTTTAKSVVPPVTSMVQSQTAPKRVNTHRVTTSGVAQTRPTGSSSKPVVAKPIVSKPRPAVSVAVTRQSMVRGSAKSIMSLAGRPHPRVTGSAPRAPTPRKVPGVAGPARFSGSQKRPISVSRSASAGLATLHVGSPDEPRSKVYKKDAKKCVLCGQWSSKLKRHVEFTHLPPCACPEISCWYCDKTESAKNSTLKHGERPTHSGKNWQFDNYQLALCVGLATGLLHDLAGRLGCESLGNLVNLATRRGWYAQEACEMSYERRMLCHLIEAYLGNHCRPGDICIQPPNCPSALLYWETLAILLSKLPQAPVPDHIIKNWEIINSPKGERIALDRVQSWLENLVQLYIDPHFHLDRTLSDFGVNSWSKLEEASTRLLTKIDGAGVTYCLQYAISNSIDPDKWHKQLSHPKVFYTIGVHPKMADKHINLTALGFAIPRKVAVGECGLDYTKSSTLPTQRLVFEEQLRLAHSYQKLLVLHLRAATDRLEDTIKVCDEARGLMKKHLSGRHSLHFHCFMANGEYVKVWLKDFPNTIFGVTSRLLGAPHGPDTIRSLKLQQMVLESDAPHLRHPRFKKAPGNSPFFLPFLAGVVGRIRNIPGMLTIEASRQVACDLYDLPI